MRIFTKILFFPAVFFGLVAFCGCVFDPIPFYAPDKLEGKANSFKISTNRLFFLYSKADEDIIQGVTVEDRTEKVKVWEIEAIREIGVRNFEVTAGEVPEGFEQLIPEPNEKFEPVPGRRYIIYIHTKFADDPRYSPHIGGYGWVAEPSNGND